MRTPDFFIVGAPKCGTTSLAAWLGAHPDVFMSPVKEPHFFSVDLDIRNRPARSAAEYATLFESATARYAAVGEASVSYLYSHAAAPAIAAAYPGARFIVCVRNPVEMALSLHGQALLSGNEDLVSFADAWEAQAARRDGHRIPARCRAPWPLQYDAVCRVGEQLDRRQRIVGRDAVCTVLLDDLDADPRTSYRAVLRFLGVRDDARAEFPALNPASVPRYPWLHAAIGRVRAARRASGLPPLGIPWLTSIDRFNRRVAPRAPLPAAERARLRANFAEDVQRLGTLLGKDLSRWT